MLTSASYVLLAGAHDAARMLKEQQLRSSKNCQARRFRENVSSVIADRGLVEALDVSRYLS